MDKKGQTLIIFVILIPIIVTMIAIVVDVGILTYEYEHTRGVIDNAIENYFEKESEIELKKILEWNEIPMENLKIEEKQNQIEVSIKYQIDSLFGKIINIKKYDIEIDRIGILENGNVKITKKDWGIWKEKKVEKVYVYFREKAG